MRRIMNVILTVVVTCGPLLAVQHTILAQAKSKRESQRKMQKSEEIEPSKNDQAERKIKAEDGMKSEETQISGAERYRAIVQNNLFMPLGSGGEVEREEFVLIGTMSGSAFIQMKGSDETFYVVEGQSFGNDTKLVRVGEKSVTIVHEGSKKELKLASGTRISQGGGAKGGGPGQRQGNSGKSSRETGSADRAGKEGWSGAEEKRRDGGEKQGGDTNWARKMSMGELQETRAKIGEYIEGLRAKGVTDPEEYEGAYEKMDTVDGAIDERESSK